MYVIGLDYGTDSVRGVLVEAENGRVAAESVCEYRRWKERRYCNIAEDEYRQHPLDYVEGLKSVMKGLASQEPALYRDVCGIGVDATGSTPCLVDRNLTPLALKPEYSENPDAMFVLWKDHSAKKEAGEITAHADGRLGCVADVCGPELFWPKLLRVIRHSPDLRKDAFSFMELCTWIPNLLCGNKEPDEVKISQSVVASKFLEDPYTRQLPPEEWFVAIDPCWLPVVRNVHPKGDTGEKVYGRISEEFAKEFGLNENVVISCGMLDGFCGAVGAGITDKMPVMNVGTSSGYLTVSHDFSKTVKGAFAQGVGQILPDMFSVEMGMAAFGDAYAWLAELLGYPLSLKGISWSKGEILSALGKDAEKIPLSDHLPYATDFFNGRRSPDQNNKLTASIMGLKLHSSAPEIYRAIVEATCFATRAIVERMAQYNMAPEAIICIGGISLKSPFVMQMLADVTGVTMKVYDSSQACALGAAMCAATASGVYSSIQEAQVAMASGIKATYLPNASDKEIIDRRYTKYCRIAQLQL